MAMPDRSGQAGVLSCRTEPPHLIRDTIAPIDPQSRSLRPPTALSTPTIARRRHRVSLVVDPRFPGGTCSAVAAEVRALAGHVDLNVTAIETAMFKGRDINPTLSRALDDHAIPLNRGPAVIRADTVVFHNPSCLKFDTRPPARISCDTAIVVCHENFLRPDGSEGFDVSACLGLLDAALVCGRRILAPVSPHNRRGVEAWVETHHSNWAIAAEDWFNICDHPAQPPARAPRDRRGRHSRPGLEKFPPPEIMRAHFPPHAEQCRILGGDTLMRDPQGTPGHWDICRFGEMDVADFLREIDFFVYYTHPLWRESFGRVIAEAIMAGKLVITDPGTAEAFDGAVVASDGSDVDEIVQSFVRAPERYEAFVRAAQDKLSCYGPEAFVRRVFTLIAPTGAEADAVL